MGCGEGRAKVLPHVEGFTMLGKCAQPLCTLSVGWTTHAPRPTNIGCPWEPQEQCLIFDRDGQD